jgi:hypothetical protein
MTGAASAVLAGLLVAAAVLVARPTVPFDRLTAGAAPQTRPDPLPAMPAPILLDLVASVLVGGAAPATAVTAVAECLLAVGDPAAAELFALAVRLATGPASAARGDPGAGSFRAVPADPAQAAGPVAGRPGPGPVSASAVLASALELAAATGLGPVPLVRAAAAEERRRRSAAQVQAARRLGVMILLPTGLCLLPAFVLLTVVPLVLDLVIG